MEHFSYRLNQLINFYLLSYSECHTASAVAVILTFGRKKLCYIVFVIVLIIV